MTLGIREKQELLEKIGIISKIIIMLVFIVYFSWLGVSTYKNNNNLQIIVSNLED